MSNVTQKEGNDMSRNLFETSPNAILVLIYVALGLDFATGRTSRISLFLANSFGVAEYIVMAFIAAGFFTAAFFIFWRSPHSYRNVMYALPLLSYNLLTFLALPLTRAPLPSGSIITILTSTLFFLLYDWQYQHRQVCETKCSTLTAEIEALKAENILLKAEVQSAARTVTE